MWKVIARLAAEDEGQDLIEYALLAGLIALVCVASITKIGDKLNTFYFSRINNALP